MIDHTEFPIEDAPRAPLRVFAVAFTIAFTVAGHVAGSGASVAFAAPGHARAAPNRDGDRDRDRDGVPDRADACPTTSEDLDGFQDRDGCPDLDDDGDRTLDVADDCPRHAGPMENRGCPELDRDRDGVVDRVDACPSQVGPASRHGCSAAPLAYIAGDAIELTRPLAFAGPALAAESRAALVAVAGLLRDRPRLRVQIEIRADSRAGRRLARFRAEAAVAAVVAAGVDARRVLPLALPCRTRCDAGPRARASVWPTIRMTGLVAPKLAGGRGAGRAVSLRAR